MSDLTQATQAAPVTTWQWLESMEVGKYIGGTRLTAALNVLQQPDHRIAFIPNKGYTYLNRFRKRSIDRPGLMDSSYS